MTALNGIESAMEAILAAIPPAWVLALTLAALNVFVFHAVMGNEHHTPVFLAPFGILGFATGNFLAWWAGSPVPMLGDVHVLEATAGAWLALSLANAWHPR